MEYSEEVGNFGRLLVYLNTRRYVLNREHMEGPQMAFRLEEEAYARRWQHGRVNPPF
jgi:hypothetical protein